MAMATLGAGLVAVKAARLFFDMEVEPEVERIELPFEFFFIRLNIPRP